MEKKLCKKCGNELPEDCNHKLCEVCRKKRNSLIKKGVLVAGAVVGTVAVVAALASSKSSDNDVYDFDNDYAGDDDVPIDDSVTAMPHQPRYKVEFRAFKTGDWYTKTETDYVNSAHSVALYNNYGRAYRVMDTYTGSVLLEADEEDGAAELAAEYRKF